MPVDVQQVLRPSHRPCRPIEADLHIASFFVLTPRPPGEGQG